MTWFAGCPDFVTAAKNKEAAKDRAASLDTVRTCGNEHFYWEAPISPRRNDDHGYIIPAGAKRP